MSSPFGWNDGLDQIRLERIKVGVMQAVGASVAQSLRLDVDRDLVFDRIVYQLTAHVLAESLPPESVSESVTVTWLQWSTWWDHFKAAYSARWWMRWWAGRRPSKTVEHARDATVTVDLRRYITYPKASIVASEFGHPVRVATWDTSTLYGPIAEASE